MITWIAFKSYPYAENLSPIDPSFNDILSKMSIKYILGKNSMRIKFSKTVKCIWISMQNYPTPFKISQIDHEILVENACWNSAFWNPGTIRLNLIENLSYKIKIYKKSFRDNSWFLDFKTLKLTLFTLQTLNHFLYLFDYIFSNLISI